MPQKKHTTRNSSRNPSRNSTRTDRNKVGKRKITQPSKLKMGMKRPRGKTPMEKERDQHINLEIPPLKKDVVRIVPIGGVEQVGKNMMLIEYGEDIVIIDAGFQFKDESTPGIDFILPNTKYLQDRKEKIRGLFITHGHLDHIGAIPYIMDKIGNPPIYTRQFGAMMIQKRQEEFPHQPSLDMRVVKGDERIKFKDLSVSFFPVGHSIPDSMGIIVETPFGDIVNTGDLKLDHVDGVPTKEQEEVYARFKNKEVLLMTLDSTNVERPGFSLPEDIVIENVQKIMRDVKGRMIIATFASQIERIIAFINYADKLNKKVVIEGRSMKSNLEIVKKLGLIKTRNVIPITEMDNYPPDRILILATGAQGEEFAALMRMANKAHKYIKLTERDTILMSSSVIPGNEGSIVKLKDNLYRNAPKVITYLDEMVHASGHAYRGEMEWVHKQINYKYFMPVHGHHYMLRIHANLAESLGTAKENIIVPDNGSIIEISDKGNKIEKLKAKAPASTVMVDGFSVGDTQEVVVRDRKLLSEDGIFIIVAVIDPRTGKLRKSPDLISRGFVYLRESQELLAQTRLIIKKSIETNTKGMNPINFDILKDDVTDDVRRFLFQKTAKSPVVIPVIIGV